MLLIWIFAIPDDFITAKIEETVAGLSNAEVSVSAEELKKGLFFTVRAKSIQLRVGDKPAFLVTELTGRINPLLIIKNELAFSMKGRIGSGSVSGSFRFPGRGSLRIENTDLDSIPYLKSLGIKSRGSLSVYLTIKDNTAKVVFEIPDLNIQEYNEIAFPLFATFRKAQGVLTIANDSIRVNSLGLEGDKGYARLSGDIAAGYMDLTLELMPTAGELTTAELMLIEQYRKSPGYYKIPVKGPMQGITGNEDSQPQRQRGIVR